MVKNENCYDEIYINSKEYEPFKNVKRTKVREKVVKIKINRRKRAKKNVDEYEK